MLSAGSGAGRAPLVLLLPLLMAASVRLLPPPPVLPTAPAAAAAAGAVLALPPPPPAAPPLVLPPLLLLRRCQRSLLPSLGLLQPRLLAAALPNCWCAKLASERVAAAGVGPSAAAART
jgi:hypothetical protein